MSRLFDLLLRGGPARAMIGRALPRLDEAARRRLARDSDRAAKERRALERALAGASRVDLCGRLCWFGWERLHEIEAPLIFLLPPLGSPSLTRSVLAAFRLDWSHERAVIPRSPEDEEIQAAAHRALAEGAAVIFAFSLPEKRRRLAVHLETPILAAPEDNAAALAARLIAALAGIVRRHPRHWAWRDPAWEGMWGFEGR